MMEDLFSENIVDNHDDIERVIEGGDDHKDESGKESENEEKIQADEGDKDKTKTKRRTGPHVLLNAERLKGPRGLKIMESFFSDMELHGKGREKQDLELVMGRLEHWTHRLFPRMQFDDCLKKIEKLGSKREVANYVKRIRLGMEEEVDLAQVDQDERADSPQAQVDPFDQLLSPSAVSTPPVNTDITAEQRERMLRNRLIAEERRAARIKKAQEMKENYQAERSLDSQNLITTADMSGTNIGEQEDDGLQEQNKSYEDMETDEHMTHVDLVDRNLLVIESKEEETLASESVSLENRSCESLPEEFRLKKKPENLTERKDSQDIPAEINKIKTDIENKRDEHLVKVLMETDEDQQNFVLETSTSQPELFDKVNENQSLSSSLKASEMIDPPVKTSCNDSDNLAIVNVNANQPDVTDKLENNYDSSSLIVSSNPRGSEIEIDEPH